MDPNPSGGDGRRRKKSRRHGRRKRPANNNKPRGNRGHQQPQHEWYAKESQRDDSSILGGRQIDKPAGDQPQRPSGPPDGFSLFCAYYLGITHNDGFKEPRLDDVARRFGMKPNEVIELLKEHKLDTETLKAIRYDLEGAKMDMRLAPEGISRTESARELYDLYLEQLEASS